MEIICYIKIPRTIQDCCYQWEILKIFFITLLSVLNKQTVLGSIMDALMMVAQKSTGEMKQVIWSFLEYKMSL